MTEFGVTSTGFNRKTTQDILTSIQTRQLSTISDKLDLSAVTPMGQNNGIIADELAQAWETLEICYHGFDPDAAEDFLLTSLGKLTGTPRRAASYSLVTLSCTLDSGTVLTSGVQFAAVDGNPGSLWTPNEDYTASSTGAQDVVFRANTTGPVSANAGTITVVHTSHTGWTAVTNAEDATPGRVADSDPTLRQRRESQLAAAGSSTVDAIEADVGALDGVVSVRCFENITDTTDADGIPAKAIEVLVFDGETPAVADNVIAQAIWDSKPAGIRTYGDESGTATDAKGESQTVYFNRPTSVPIYIDITVETGAGYVGDTAVKEQIVAQGAAFYGVGDDVKARQLDSVVFGLTGVEDVTVFELDTTASPSATANIAIASREIASFDTSRITVTTV